MFTSPNYQERAEAGGVAATGIRGPVAVGGRFGLSSLFRLAKNPQVQRAAYQTAARAYPRTTKALGAAARTAKTASRAAKKTAGRVGKAAKKAAKKARPKKKQRPGVTGTALVPRTFTGTSARTPAMNRVMQAARKRLGNIQKNIKDPKKRRAAMMTAIKEVGKGGLAFGTTAAIAAAVDAVSSGKTVTAQDMKDITQKAGYHVMQDALKGKKMNAARMNEIVASETRKQMSSKPSGPVSQRRQLAALGLQQLEKILLKRYRDFGRKTTSSGRQHRIILNRGGGGKRRKRVGGTVRQVGKGVKVG